MPPIPQRIRDEIPNLPNNYQMTHREDHFLLHDSGVGDVDTKSFSVFLHCCLTKQRQPTIVCLCMYWNDSDNILLDFERAAINAVGKISEKAVYRSTFLTT